MGERCNDQSVWKGCAMPKGHEGGHCTYDISEALKASAPKPAPTAPGGDGTAKLAACPWCKTTKMGLPDGLYVEDEETPEHVYCYGCEASGPSAGPWGWNRNREDAVAAWNRRSLPSPDTQGVRRAALEEAAQVCEAMLADFPGTSRAEGMGMCMRAIRALMEKP